MKKASVLLIALFFGITFKGISQTATPAEFYVGKWEMAILGTPNGDAKMPVEISLKEGKLSGEITNPEDPSGAKIPMSSIETEGGLLTVFFSMAGYDLSIAFTKVDDDNFKGKLMDMFESSMKRIKL